MEVGYMSKFWLDIFVSWFLYQLLYQLLFGRAFISVKSLNIGLSYLLAIICRERYILVDLLLNCSLKCDSLNFCVSQLLKSDSLSLCLCVSLLLKSDSFSLCVSLLLKSDFFSLCL